MRIFASRSAKKHIKSALNDNDYFNDLEQRDSYIRSITEGMESPFGAVLLNALDVIESTATENLIARSNEADSRAEIKLARFVRATLMSYVSEQEALSNAINQYNEMEKGEFDDNQL